jgi:hypothetical protein
VTTVHIKLNRALNNSKIITTTTTTIIIIIIIIIIIDHAGSGSTCGSKKPRRYMYKYCCMNKLRSKRV